MARFFNPIPVGRTHSSGVGKTTVTRMFRIRDLLTTLDRMHRYGGEYCEPGLIEENLGAANSPFICITDPALSNLVNFNGTIIGWEGVRLEDTEDGAQAVNSNLVLPFVAQESFDGLVQSINALAGRRHQDSPLIDIPLINTVDHELDIFGMNQIFTLEAAMVLQHYLRSGAYTVVDNLGTERNAIEIIPQVIGMRDQVWYFVHVGHDLPGYAPDFIFCVEPVDFRLMCPYMDANLLAERWVRLRYVIRHGMSTFKGTGIVNQVVVEGFTNPAVTATVIRDLTIPNTRYQAAEQFAQFITEEQSQDVDLWANSGPTTLSSIPGRNAVTLGYAFITYPDLMVRLTGQSLAETITWEDLIRENAVLSTAQDAFDLLQAVRVLSINRYNNIIRRFDATMLSFNQQTVAIHGSLVNKRYDVFYRWIVEPIGDTFVETLGQIWNHVTPSETTLKNGLSSGINRAFDVGTGNALWALYVSRSDATNDPVNKGDLAGLEGGTTFYEFNGGYLAPRVYSTHRSTQRRIAHVLCDYCYFSECDDRLVVFVDTPQPHKNTRLVYFFRVNPQNVSTFLNAAMITADHIQVVDNNGRLVGTGELKPPQFVELLQWDMLSEIAAIGDDEHVTTEGVQQRPQLFNEGSFFTDVGGHNE